MKRNFIVPLFTSDLHIYVGVQHGAEFEKKGNTCLIDKYTFDPSDIGVCCGSHLYLREPDMPTFAHEISHFIDALINHVGVGNENGEIRAYLHQWAWAEVWPKIVVK